MLYYTIFTQKVANKLESMGFQVQKIVPNRRDPRYRVYYFEDTIELRQALREILAAK